LRSLLTSAACFSARGRVTMVFLVIAFISGISLVQFLPDLPTVTVAPWLCLAGFLTCLRLPRLGVFLLGVSYALWYGQTQLEQRLPPAWEGQNITVEGKVTALPVPRSHGLRFQFITDTAVLGDGEKLLWPRTLMLSWYNDAPLLRTGSHWRLTLRLKQPNGSRNPGALDWETWLFANHVAAVGYVRDGEALAYSATPTDIRSRIDGMRQSLAAQMSEQLADSPLRGMLLALVVGAQDAITPKQWDILAATGTIHLLSISGLHISMVAGLVFWLMRWSWACVPWLVLRVPAIYPAALSAIVAAVSYSALAGFSVPTQRSLIMIVVAMCALMSRRSIAASTTLAIAALLVVLWEPLSVLVIGFWLSFLSVAAIFFGMHDRLRAHNWWWKYGRIHLLLLFALLPAMLFLFGQVSWVSPLANFFAVPWVGLLVVPLALLGALLLPIISDLGAILLSAAEFILQGCWRCLSQLVDVGPVQQSFPALTVLQLISVTLGLIWLLAPRGTPGRWLGLGLVLPPLYLSQPPRPADGELWMTLLDVGQGLAVMVQTREHLLLYDAGPKYPDGFDAGKNVVVPALRRAGWTAVDAFMLGHGDNDHSGGADAVLNSYSVARFISGDPRYVVAQRAEPCRAGVQWRWDGVSFAVLSPVLGDQLRKENDNSCVLRIATDNGALLLPGDIEAAGEKHLVDNRQPQLRANVMVLPHHGSISSSTELFIDAVVPTLAFASVGYRNRFGFPNEKVLDRYRQRHINVLTTADCGALELHINRAGVLNYYSFRLQGRHYWHRRTVCSVDALQMPSL